jgi:hypothetical protein
MISAVKIATGTYPDTEFFSSFFGGPRCEYTMRGPTTLGVAAAKCPFSGAV